MRFESGETRQHTKSDKQQAPQDTFASSERAIFGLSGEFTIELQGSLRGLVEDARHEHERMIADRRLQSGTICSSHQEQHPQIFLPLKP